MTRQGQILLLVVIALAVTGGAVLSGSANVDGASAKALISVRNSSVRRGLADATQPAMDDWQAPRWSVLSSGNGLLRANHPLFRRPSYPGENRYKVMCEGWGGWYYSPPSETYF